MATPYTQDQVNAYVGELQKLVQSGELTQDVANRTIANELRKATTDPVVGMQLSQQIATAFDPTGKQLTGQDVAQLYNQLAISEIQKGNLGVSGGLSAAENPELYQTFEKNYSARAYPDANPVANPVAGAGAESIFNADQGALNDAQSTTLGQTPVSMFDTSLDFMKSSADQTKTLGSFAPSTVSAGTLPTVNIADYMNPYTDNVVNASMADLERQRLMQQQQISAQASAAGAFGGTRQGVAQSLTNEAFARQAAQTSANLRQAGFSQAQQQAQTDLGRQMTADQTNQTAGLAGAQFRLGAQQQLGGMGLTGYNLANDQFNQFMQNEALKQQQQQTLYGQETAEAQSFFGQPTQTLGYVSSALGASPTPQTTTATRQPGIFDYATLGAYMQASDERLKKDIEHVKTLDNGVNVVRWDWNDIGKKIADPSQSTYGVIAQQVAAIFPEAIYQRVDGYLMVDYSHPGLRSL
tara:strand:- start:221 stop:1624 length:1404 start_codon:yes stop_codon:yes gene_type:complete